MTLVDVIGFLAATCTTASFLPQAVRIWRTRETRAISLVMYSIFSTGVALWVIYGFLAPSWPVFAANVVTLVFALSILVMKLRYDQPLTVDSVRSDNARVSPDIDGPDGDGPNGDGQALNTRAPRH